MDAFGGDLHSLALANNFSGVIDVAAPDHEPFRAAYGLAHRAMAVPNMLTTQFAIASGVKGFTALTIVSLIEDGLLDSSTAARSILGNDLPLIDDRVTVEHLLAHRSGIGDYLDEDTDLDLNDYLMPVPVQDLATTEQYLPALDGHPQKFEPGSNFSYCNSGYVVLALIAERVSGTAFQDLLRERVCRKAGMVDTEFLRSDELPGRAALGYLSSEGNRINVLHLPVRGNGDGGIYTTVDDMGAFWDALTAGAIVSHEWVQRMTTPRSIVKDTLAYGLGFWLHRPGRALHLEGMDAGVSFRSVFDPERGHRYTVIGNDAEGTWPIARHLATHFGELGAG